MKVVITGGCGFIGSNLAHELMNENEVIVIDDLSTGRIENIANLKNSENFKFVRGSITDLNLLKQVFKDVDYVFHQAAIPSVQRSVENPIATNEANINGTLNVLLAARDSGVKKVIYASSSSVYGDTPILPKREDMKPNPKSPYAVSKLVGEYYCKVFSEVYGLKTVCLRYFNVYGPKQDPYSEYAAVIPRFITRALNDQPPVIFGDGNQTRDFTFVKDVVKANILAMEKNVEGVFNIACGNRISIKELANKILEIMGLKLSPVCDKPRPGDIRHSLADISLARERLGYVPEYDLEKGLEVTIKWFSESSKRS
ncbi:MAG: SDR family oxidoreductase [Candidatus Syntropharchaeia archaeon]